MANRCDVAVGNWRQENQPLETWFRSHRERIVLPCFFPLCVCMLACTLGLYVLLSNTLIYLPVRAVTVYCRTCKECNITLSACVKPRNIFEVHQKNCILCIVLFCAAKHCKLKVFAFLACSAQKYQRLGHCMGFTRVRASVLGSAFVCSCGA